MTIRTKAQLKALFESGDTLLESSFVDLIDSTHEIDANGNLLLPSNASRPTAPAVDWLQVYARRRAGADWLEFQRPNGRDVPLQPHFGVNRVGTWLPSATTAVSLQGMPRTGVGTVSHPALAATNLLTSSRRWRMTSAATAGSANDERSPVTQVWRGNAAGLGGWLYTNRLGLVTLPATSRAFFGLHSSISALSLTLDVYSLINCVGIGFEQGVDSNWQVIHNDGAGVAQKIDMGANFPVSVNNALYTVYIYCPVNGSSIFLRVNDESSGNFYDTELTTEIPSDSTFLAVRNYMNNGSTASACAYDCAGVYLESDY